MSENLKFEVINEGKTLRISAENPADFAEYIKNHDDDMLTSYQPNSDQAFWIVSEEIAGYILKGNGSEWYQNKPIKGITKAKDQNTGNYGRCL